MPLVSTQFTIRKITRYRVTTGTIALLLRLAAEETHIARQAPGKQSAMRGIGDIRTIDAYS